jgi:hypothetical protein
VAALTHDSAAVTPPAPAATTKTRRGPQAALPVAGVEHEKIYSADVQLSRVNITGFM